MITIDDKKIQAAIAANPFRRSTKNLTAQAIMLRQNPTLAAKAKAAAEEEDAPAQSTSSAAGKSSAQENPWLPASRNLTRQVQITRADPALAERLKAAAANSY